MLLAHPHAGGEERHGLGAARKVVQQQVDEAGIDDIAAVGVRSACGKGSSRGTAGGAKGLGGLQD